MATVEQDITQQSNADDNSFSSTLKKAIDASTSISVADEHAVNRYFYTVGSFNFLLEENLKAETLKNTSMNSVPYLPKWYNGIISIRGIIMPVIDIHAFVQSQMKKSKENGTGNSYLLKIEHKDCAPIVFKVDKLPELINIKKCKKTKAAKSSPDWMQHYYKQGSTKIVQVNHSELLNQIINSQ